MRIGSEIDWITKTGAVSSPQARAGKANLVEEVNNGIDVTLGFKTESRFDGDRLLY